MKRLLKRASRRLDIGAALGALVRELPNTRDGSPMGRKTRSASRPEKRKSNPIGGPVGGWGSAGSLIEILLREHIPLKGASTLLRQNKPRGYACVRCSYAKPADAKTFEFCENGAKATAWEITNRRFFTEHTVSQLYAEGSKGYPSEWRNMRRKLVISLAYPDDGCRISSQGPISSEA